MGGMGGLSLGSPATQSRPLIVPPAPIISLSLIWVLFAGARIFIPLAKQKSLAQREAMSEQDKQLYTVKYVDDPRVSYKELAIRLFGDNKCIVSPIEKGKLGKDHVHFIGYIDMTKEEFSELKTEICAEHPKRKDVHEDGD